MNINPEKAGMNMLSGKVDVRAKKIAKVSKCPLYNDERINSPRRHSNLKCVFAKLQNT